MPFFDLCMDIMDTSDFGAFDQEKSDPMMADLPMGGMGGGIMGGDGLDGFLPQDDEGKLPFGDQEEDIFAGTDMAGDPVGEDLSIGDAGALLEVKDESDELSEIGRWESEHRSALMEKRNKARAEKEKLLENAKADIEKFYNERKEKQNNIKTQNKENEQNYFSEMGDLMQYGDPWEKVGRLVNLTPKPNEKPGTSKVDRMRGLLIQLKNEKPSAQE